ncbi:MAG: PAS domain-containing protein [Treponema sp.]
MESMADYLKDVDKKKLETVLEIKDAFNSGRMTLKEAKALLKEKVGTVTPAEIALAEQELKEIEDDECRKEDIQGMLALFEDVMDTSRPELPESHPISCYYRENDALLKIMLEIEDLVQYPLIKNQWLEIYDKLALYKLHFSRKQNQLYSMLERKGFDRPTHTMWTLDDFIRDEIKQARSLLDADKDDDFLAMQPTIVADVRDLVTKENTVLYPTSLALLSIEEFEDMKIGDKEIGFAWIDAPDIPHKTTGKAGTTAKTPVSGNNDFAQELSLLLQKYGYSAGGNAHEKFKVTTGELTLDQINLIYKHMPVDISYVDENEKVCFYSDTDHRVFPRSKNVIGRDVKNCHPKASVHIVEEIIEKFRSGKEDTAEFWINKPEIFIYIYYVAVRDADGTFRGVLEMMQDCTHIRSLEGSQTLLTWGSGKKEATAQEEKSGGAENDVPSGDNSGTEGQSAAASANESVLLPLKAETKLSDLLAAYPKLKTDLASINSAFKMLQTPLARIMIPKATVSIMSERSQMPLDELIAALEKKIMQYESGRER